MGRFTEGEIIQLPQASARKQKPGPGRSSTGLITGTRVFALWSENQHYFSAVVQRRENDRYWVRFDEDDSEALVPLAHMRLCAKLEAGDTIILKSDTVQISKIMTDGSLAIEENLTVNDIIISAWIIDAQWEDRKLTHEEINCADGA
ncbi:hypothetical protein B0H15DRAFT_851922 [Mycena belliarum]|uniref:DNA repair protein Crb2 Tudor domain-containing protein n=1 Tax=Mycena belliarum TaxID=1033014 RepID=A0AAD6TXD4_9AGAR|nr:hypothetical protein B0H15DRAFT_851922 [Mycena belliae]